MLPAPSTLFCEINQFNKFKTIKSYPNFQSRSMFSHFKTIKIVLGLLRLYFSILNLILAFRIWSTHGGTKNKIELKIPL
jgi:hypothetical protein